MYIGCVCFRGEFGFLNCDDSCMCVVNKQFELLEFVLIPVYVDLQYDEISLTFLLGLCVCVVFVVCGSPWSVCEVIVVPYVECGDCDACFVVCVACVCAARMTAVLVWGSGGGVVTVCAYMGGTRGQVFV